MGTPLSFHAHAHTSDIHSQILSRITIKINNTVNLPVFSILHLKKTRYLGVVATSNGLSKNFVQLHVDANTKTC